MGGFAPQWGALPPKPPRIYRCFCQSGWYLFLPLSAAAVQWRSLIGG
jgi:hypothetical protein